ncbi:MAG: iron-containing alcohol dehydrogenase [Bacilli bacterium]|nr:iron-containing alcohol dehydrogenase [Bacilli bacterium]
MNPFYIAYARTFQFLLARMGRLLKYKEPKRLSSALEIASFLKENGKSHPFLVSGRSTFASPASQGIILALNKEGIKVTPYLMQGKEPSIKECEVMGESYIKEGCDCIISIGGGSRMDAAKSLAVHLAYIDKPIINFKGVLKVHRDLPLHIAIPTTAGSASEDSISMVLTDESHGDKFAITSPRLLPKAYYFDARYLMEIPPLQGAESGMDAIAHNLESYLGSALPKKDREITVSAIASLYKNLETFYCSKRTKEVALELFECSRIGGYSFSRGYVGYVHALAHALGGKTHLSHGKLIAILLPHVLLAYKNKAHKKLAYLCDRLNLTPDKSQTNAEKASLFIGYLTTLGQKMGISASLGLNLSEKELNDIVDHAYKEANPFYPVPRILTKKELRDIVLEANKTWM